VLEVVEPGNDAVLDVAVGLFLRLGDVHGAHEPPGLAVDARAVVSGPFLHHVPVVGEEVEADGHRCPDRQQPEAIAAGQAGPRR
jgi:hypothetical protein